jgi:hypothetical protein
VIDPVQLSLGKQFLAVEVLHYDAKLYLAVHVDGLVKLFDLKGYKVVKRLEKVSCKNVIKLLFFVCFILYFSDFFSYSFLFSSILSIIRLVRCFLIC